MSDVAVGRVAGGDAIFRLRTVALMLAMGIVGFVGMLVVGAYAPDMRSGRNGGAHALSNAAVGFSGIVRLAAATGRDPRIVRNDHDYGSEDLLVLTPESGFVELSAPLNARKAKPTLIVLPKWNTSKDEVHSGWVTFDGVIPRFMPESVMSPAYKLRIRRYRSGGKPLLATARGLPANLAFTAPHPLQAIVGMEGQPGADGTLRPLLVDGGGHVVVGQLGEGPLYVLADPDLLNNLGMKDARRAVSALALLDWMNSTGATSIGFDVTANGFGHSASPLKLAFDPPFLAMTLAIAAVLLLLGLRALCRFGPVRRRARAIAFGKAALVDNGAAMVRKANRETQLGGRYAQLIRERAAAAFGLPAQLRDAALDERLDALGGTRRFTDLARVAEAAADRPALVAAARALHHWQQEKTA